MTELSFDALKKTVEAEYPGPLASVFRRCRVASKEDLGGRHKNLVDLFEVFIKYVCIVQLQEARVLLPDLASRLPQKEKSLEFLKRPSLGSWIGLLRILSKLDTDAVESRWLKQISEWYFEPKNENSASALSQLNQIEGVKYEKRTKTPNAEICNALVSYRNKHLAHAANLRSEELEKRLPILESVLSYLINSASFLSEMVPFYVDRIEVAENSQWKIQATKLMGATEEPVSYRCAEKLELSEIYLSDSSGGEISSAPISLGPFILWQMNADLKRSEAFFYNDAWRTKLEYLSYLSGSYYYHKELHEGFSELIKLKLKPGAEEDAYRDMAPEERSLKAEELFKRAMLQVSEGRLEDALEAFEHSAEFERRPGTFFELAKVQRTLGDPDEAVLQTLGYCFDLDPSHKKALTFRTEIDGATEGQTLEAPDDESENERITFFHALTPKRFRRIAVPWWLALVLTWYGFSFVFDLFWGSPENLPSVVLIWAGVTAVVFTISIGKTLLDGLKLP
ncbi:MAG: hypothetical protein JRF33_25695, partial [Deltaproteobacteria bacterium]|nr:hypothetical protein [Deltaproteobacteria bacterium]